MGSLVLGILAFFVLAIGQGVVRRTRNPYGEVNYTELPDALRSEIERVLPGFEQISARLTRRENEARVEGSVGGKPVAIEADLDAQGSLLEFEADTRRPRRKMGLALPADLSDPACRELDRILGEARSGFQFARVRVGMTRDGEKVFEVKGHSGDWKWEIELTAAGELLEVDREKRLRRR